MKKLLSLTIATCCVALVAFTPAGEEKVLPIGSDIPQANAKMLDVVTGKKVSIADVKGENGTIVIFSCNTCPWVIKNENRIKELIAVSSRLKVGVIILNSNEAQRGDVDSQDAMKEYAGNQSFAAPYVIDKNHVVADAFGATRTPEIFLFDKVGKLIYRGAIDDNPSDVNEVKERYLMNALQANAAGNKPSVNDTKSVGCTIKRLKN